MLHQCADLFCTRTVLPSDVLHSHFCEYKWEIINILLYIFVIIVIITTYKMVWNRTAQNSFFSKQREQKLPLCLLLLCPIWWPRSCCSCSTPAYSYCVYTSTESWLKVRTLQNIMLIMEYANFYSGKSTTLLLISYNKICLDFYVTAAPMLSAHITAKFPPAVEGFQKNWQMVIWCSCCG